MATAFSYEVALAAFKKPGGSWKTLFLEVYPDVLGWDGVRYTPDIANMTGVAVHTIEEARGLIDFEILYTRTNWSDPAIQQRLQQAERCEVLVPHHIPLTLIRNLPNG